MSSHFQWLLIPSLSSSVLCCQPLGNKWLPHSYLEDCCAAVGHWEGNWFVFLVKVLIFAVVCISIIVSLTSELNRTIFGFRFILRLLHDIPLQVYSGGSWVWPITGALGTQSSISQHGICAVRSVKLPDDFWPVAGSRPWNAVWHFSGHFQHG